MLIMSEPDQANIDDFIERMGLSAQADGLPRIAGRMLGLFIVYDGPFSFSGLAERLLVSRGSISTNARLLENLGIIERLARPGDRQDYFQLTRDPYGRLLEGYLERMRRTHSIIERARREINDASPGTRQRLQEIGDFYQTAIDNTAALIKRWRSEYPGSRN
jgi:DNA-binding transcriptional regulator GbsR (MarR family)